MPSALTTRPGFLGTRQDRAVDLFLADPSTAPRAFAAVPWSPPEHRAGLAFFLSTISRGTRRAIGRTRPGGSPPVAQSRVGPTSEIVVDRGIAAFVVLPPGCTCVWLLGGTVSHLFGFLTALTTCAPSTRLVPVFSQLCGFSLSIRFASPLCPSACTTCPTIA